MNKRAVTPPIAVGKLTSAQKVELYIKEAILHGELKPRERIIEVELAKRVGCSRAPVRQAVQRLVREGLIVTVPRRGVFIRDFTPGAVDEIFRMRAKLEALCVLYLRRRMTGKDKIALRQALEPMRLAQAANDQEAFLEADMNLHRLIWRLSGCQEIQRTLNAIMVPFILMVARLNWMSVLTLRGRLRWRMKPFGALLVGK